MKNPQAFLVAEVYQPHLYRDYIHLGKMDALYDKVDLYDTLKGIIRGHTRTSEITRIQNELADIEPNMLHFLDNHDEQRIPCEAFAGSAEAALPAMVLSATISRAPTMLYFGQEVGEAGTEMAGFGQPTRTSIFDYIGVPAHQRWMNDGAFDGGQSSQQEKQLRDYYQRLMQVSLSCPAFNGGMIPIGIEQDSAHGELADRLYGFVRSWKEHKALVVTNFDANSATTCPIALSKASFDALALPDGYYPLNCSLEPSKSAVLRVHQGRTVLDMNIKPLASHIFELTSVAK